MTARSHMASLTLALAGALVACDGSGSDEPIPTATLEAPAEIKAFRFILDGPLPWNETVYYATGDGIDGDEAYSGAILSSGGLFIVRGSEGAPYHIRSEPRPSAAEKRVLWMVEARGVLGDGLTDITAEAIRVEAPPRALIRFEAPGGSAGPDSVTLFQEETRTRATAYRDPRSAFFLAVWDDHAGNAYRQLAPPRPWVVQDFAPGRYVIAARTEGRQWAAWRAELSPERPFEIDSGVQSQGGATIICEDADALLLLNGELAIPAPRITTTLQYRAAWHGVPPGKHAVLYPDGRRVGVEVADDQELRLGK